MGSPASEGPLPGGAGYPTPHTLNPPGGRRGARSENPVSPWSPPNRVRDVLSRGHHGTATARRLNSRYMPMAPCPVSHSVACRRQPADRPGSEGPAKSPATMQPFTLGNRRVPCPPGRRRAGLGFRGPASHGMCRAGAAVGAELRRPVCGGPDLACGGRIDRRPFESCTRQTPACNCNDTWCCNFVTRAAGSLRMVSLPLDFPSTRVILPSSPDRATSQVGDGCLGRQSFLAQDPGRVCGLRVSGRRNSRLEAS